MSPEPYNDKKKNAHGHPQGKVD